jgi:hypothetical protein
LIYEGAAANAEAVRMMETREDGRFDKERWNIWKKGEALYPNYLWPTRLRLMGENPPILILIREQMQQEALKRMRVRSWMIS